MFSKILTGIFGTSNDRFLKALQPVVNEINSYEPELEALNDQELRAKTEYFIEQLNSGKTLDDILPEAFAVVREASKRTLGLRHFDVQLIGGIVLHRGMISEMKTGEGKTLVATLAVYLNALAKKGVHVITVNDYLVKRDSEEMGKIYNFLGLTVGAITSGIDENERKSAYEADITYGTNNEFGFDYLRDNLKFDSAHMVQREFNYAIVDELDSILIDEARTPLIISGPTEDNSELYTKIDKLIPKLVSEDYEVDEKARSAYLTDQGNHSIEALLKSAGIIADQSSLYDFENMLIVHHVNQALRAHKLFQKDVDYIVKDNKVMIIDEFTGRIMEGRRYSEGLHQALEAKEKVAIQNENQTLASVTYQNYFRMYPKLAGMTGTAMTEAQEFSDIYKLEVISIPTNVPVARKDEEDEIYLTAEEKYDAIIAEIQKCKESGQPVLVGTVSIEKSELLSSLLKKHKIQHQVLNARYHEQEAYIIAQAGRVGAVTIATNMAGRGTDIKLGGNPKMMLLEASRGKNLTEAQIASEIKKIEKQVAEERQKVIDAGGLFILGTERHESRRIDNQLRGRSGRQGDVGRSKFYLSLEDDLMRIFGSEKIKGLLSKIGIKKGEAIVHPWISRSLEKAQQKVEARNYDIRKTLLKFDDVMNEQRKVIYDQRRFFLSEASLISFLKESATEVVYGLVPNFMPEGSLPEEWNLEGLQKEVHAYFGIDFDPKEITDKNGTEIDVAKKINELVHQIIDQKSEQYSEEIVTAASKQILLLTLDQLWKEHLHTLDHLRTGIGLRAYAQKDPLNEYKIEAFNMFSHMMDEFNTLAIRRFCHLQISTETRDVPELARPRKTKETRVDPAMLEQMAKDATPKLRQVQANVAPEDRDPSDPSTWGKVSRNEDCPCGSGKKYKQCHGAI